ncbi:hypothetical protein ACX93W_11255 [Paenibacillus sp. CAU 1782]
MEQIYPLNEDIIARYCGLPVCAVMKSGIRYVGTLATSRASAIQLDIGFGSPYNPGNSRLNHYPGHFGNADISTDGQNQEHDANTNEHQRTTESSAPITQKKKKRVKASTKSSTTKYAKKVSNPAAREKNEENSGLITLNLDEILFLVRIV